MSTDPALIAAIAKNATYIATLDAAAKKKKLTPKQEASRASAVAKFDAYVLRYAASLGGTTAPPVTPPAPPVVPGDAITKAKSWDHVQAKDEIAANWPAGSTATPAERLAALGPGQFGRAVALGMFGSPDDTPLTADQYALGDAHGGYWGRQAHGDSGRFVQTIYNASQKVAEVVTPSPMSSDEARALGKANGLNDDENGPA